MGSPSSKVASSPESAAIVSSPPALQVQSRSLTRDFGEDADLKISWWRYGALLLLWTTSVCCWTVGCFVLPTLEINILHDTPFNSFYERSLWRTQIDLYHKGTYFAVLILGFFSVVVPILKLCATLWLIMQLGTEAPRPIYSKHERIIHWLSYIASYQCLDMYVGVLFVVHFNSDSSISEFESGFYWFFTYCMVSMFMSSTLDGAFYCCLHKEEQPLLSDMHSGDVQACGLSLDEATLPLVFPNR
eukprot:TRINITY_DN12181_c0_g1_i1.p1 TRINITY_DN12181_c0_g1~~TRINITY_DN12181_c0_g1_i1.p1  ORF type:complete len:245 (+),score=39.59 TRINITY_DN12181_c0_g1_i1:109-843(+)